MAIFSLIKDKLFSFIEDTVIPALSKNRLSSLPFALFELRRYGFLREVGWFNSFQKQLSVDALDKPLPWLTYPAISFLESAVHKEMCVFEYGSGASTLWWAERVKHVVACEHSKQWHDLLKPEVPGNASLMFCELVPDGDYCRSIHSSDETFDIIVIDGRDRVNCIRQAYSKMKNDGIIILDDSERDRYQPGQDFLLQQGFLRLDFHGIRPIALRSSCTSIFFKTTNFLKQSAANTRLTEE